MQLENAQTADLVFVVSKQYQRLMPCSPAKARKLLCQKKAKVIRRTPFTIKLLFNSTGYIQPVTAAIDSGSGKIGCAAVTSSGRVLYLSEIEIRSDVSP